MVFFASLLLCLYVIRLWLTGFGGLHPDESYYWVWAQDLKMGYHDHPPMIAWIISLGSHIVDFLFSEELKSDYPYFFSVVKFKAGPLFLSSVLTPMFIGKCIEWVQRAPLRVTQIIALVLCPIFLLGPQIVTPDTPFFLGWTLCLLAAIGFQKRRFHNHILGDPTPSLLSLSILSGFALALCAYSKYSAILAAFLLILSGCGLWNALMMGILSLILTLPYFIWMSSDGIADGSGIIFQFNNALGDPFKANNFKFVGDLWASQIFLWTPFVFIAVFIFLFTDLRRFFLSVKSSRLSGTLFLWALVPVFFFSLTALKRPAEANWPLIGFLAAIVMTLSRLHKRPITLWILISQNIFLLFSTWLLLTQTPTVSRWVQDISPKLSAQLSKPSRLHELYGWDRLHTLLEDTTRSDNSPILIESYQIMSSLLFIDSSKTIEHQIASRMFYLDEHSRKSEFSRTPKFLYPHNLNLQSHWRLMRSRTEMSNCRPYQGLLKEAHAVYHLYKCNENL